MLVLSGVELIFITMAGIGFIFAEHSVDNVEMFLLLLSRGYTEPKPFLIFLVPDCCVCGDAGEVGRRYSQDR